MGRRHGGWPERVPRPEAAKLSREEQQRLHAHAKKLVSESLIFREIIGEVQLARGRLYLRRYREAKNLMARITPLGPRSMLLETPRRNSWTEQKRGQLATGLKYMESDIRGTLWNTPAVSMSWESWSLNGEACIESRVPADSGGAKLTEYLWRTMRELASHCRRTYDVGGMIPFEFQGHRTPSAFAKALDHWFDVALLDPISIRERVRRLGVDNDTSKWPAYWVERENILLLAEERQVTIPAASGRMPASARRNWEACLHVVGNAAEIGIPNTAAKDKHSFLAGILVAVHKQPPGKARRRPSLDDSLHRHEELVTALGQVSEAESRPVTWHALWRLPPDMVVADPPRSDPWMHYPAVSVVSSVAPLADSRRNDETCS